MNIVIVGGGFGGVKTALELSKKKSYKITLISDKSYFQYYPALYSTATGRSYKKSWIPLEALFESAENVTLIKDRVIAVDAGNHVVKSVTNKTYRYDELVLALGSVTTYFGIKGLDQYAFGIKSHEEIVALQEHIINDMEDGVEDEKRYVVVGAGATGVELAGALGEYIKVLRKRYGIKKHGVHISLIEAAPRILPRSSKLGSSLALKRLRKLHVHVETNKKVERQTADALIVNGKPLVTQTVVWTSGVANPSFYQDNPLYFDLNERGKVKVDEFMRARAHVYVIGDNANTPFAGFAQTALYDASFVANHIQGSTKPYKPRQPKSVIPIGYRWALYDGKWLVFSGLLAAVVRELADLIGYHDVLPLGDAIRHWLARSEKEIHIPKRME